MEDGDGKVDFHPLGDRVIVRPEQGPEVTGGGIVLPESAREKPLRGEVVARGPDATEHLQPGKVVAFSKYAGVEIHLDQGDFLILREQDVLGLVG